MFGVHQQSGKFIAVFVQSKKDTEAYVINAAGHGAIHGFGMVVVIMFGTRGVELQITFFMVRFLEEDVSTDPCITELSIILHRRCGDIHIHPADSAIFMFNPINRIDAFQYIFNGIVFWDPRRIQWPNAYGPYPVKR